MCMYVLASFPGFPLRTSEAMYVPEWTAFAHVAHASCPSGVALSSIKKAGGK